MTAINSNRAIRGPVTAVPVVAGKGVRLVADTENNRWVVEADETVLWEEATGESQSTSCTCSEALTNFELVLIIFKTNDKYKQCAIYPGDSSGFPYSVVSTYSGTIYSKNSMWSPDAYHLTLTRSACTESNNYSTVNNSDVIWIVKVVGINRIASN